MLIQLARCLVFEAADYLVQLYSSHETANEWYNVFQKKKQRITIARVRQGEAKSDKVCQRSRLRFPILVIKYA